MRRIAIRANIKPFDRNNTKVFKEISSNTPEIGNRAIRTADRLEITTPIRILKYKSVHNLWPNFKCVLANAGTEPDAPWQDQEILSVFAQVPRTRGLANQHGQHLSSLDSRITVETVCSHNADWTVQLVCHYRIS